MTEATQPTARSVPVPFLLRRENIVRYEDGAVWILDRRAYPFERSFVRCSTHEDVAQAIEAMVTQSMGPGPAAGYGLALAARDVRLLPAANQGESLRRAADRLIATRRTNNSIQSVVRTMLEHGLTTLETGADPEEAILEAMEAYWATHEARTAAVGAAGAPLIEPGDRLLTHCWGTPFVYVVRAALERGTDFEVVCTETRPYLQGARLTADVVAEMGVRTTVITDGMPAHLMAEGLVTRFFSGADRVTMDGHLVNKIGTLGIAIAAHRYGVPAYGVCLGPDRASRSPADVPLEDRDPDEVLECRGVRTASPQAHGYYPAFDVTPPDLLTGFVTDRGVFAPGAVPEYFVNP